MCSLRCTHPHIPQFLQNLANVLLHCMYNFTCIYSFIIQCTRYLKYQNILFLYIYISYLCLLSISKIPKYISVIQYTVCTSLNRLNFNLRCYSHWPSRCQSVSRLFCMPSSRTSCISIVQPRFARHLP